MSLILENINMPNTCIECMEKYHFNRLYNCENNTYFHKADFKKERFSGCPIKEISELHGKTG